MPYVIQHGSKTTKRYNLADARLCLLKVMKEEHGKANVNTDYIIERRFTAKHQAIYAEGHKPVAWWRSYPLAKGET